jgi:hypothetical protein
MTTYSFKPLSDLDLTTRTHNLLVLAGIVNCEQLFTRSVVEIELAISLVNINGLDMKHIIREVTETKEFYATKQAAPNTLGLYSALITRGIQCKGWNSDTNTILLPSMTSSEAFALTVGLNVAGGYYTVTCELIGSLSYQLRLS